jgi:hypothetical protein
LLVNAKWTLLLIARCTRYNITWSILSVTCRISVDFLRVPRFLHQLNWSPRYNWNIVENGVNQPNINYYAIIFWIMRIKISIITYWLANCFKVYMNIYGLIRTTFWKVSPLLANYISTITYMVKILEDRNLKLVFAVFL